MTAKSLRPLCAATSKQTGRRCGARAVLGGTVCKWHGGTTPQVQAVARRRLLAAEAIADLARLGMSIETSPIEALEAMLWEAAGNVAILRELVGTLGLHADTILLVEDVDGEDMVIPVTSGGIAGQVRADSAEAKPHIWVVMYNDERDRLGRLAKDCAALGLEERKVAMAGATTERLFSGVARALTAAGLTGEQRQAFTQALAKELRAG